MTCMARQERSGASNEEGTRRGLANALLIAIPLWAFFGIVMLMVLRQGHVGEIGSAALMIAAACELIVARPYVRAFCSEFWRRTELRRAGSQRREGRPPESSDRKIAFDGRNRWHDDRGTATGRRVDSIGDLLRQIEPKRPSWMRVRREIAPNAILRQSLLLSALVGAYLQYYFLDVHLQIASLHSVTVFVPVS